MVVEWVRDEAPGTVGENAAMGWTSRGTLGGISGRRAGRTGEPGIGTVATSRAARSAEPPSEPDGHSALAARRAGREGDRPRQGRTDADDLAGPSPRPPRARPSWSARAAATGCWRSTTKGNRSPSGSTRWGSRRSCSSTGWARAIIIRRCSRTPAARSGRCAPRGRSGSSTRTRSRSSASRPAATWPRRPAPISTPASPTPKTRSNGSARGRTA